MLRTARTDDIVARANMVPHESQETDLSSTHPQLNSSATKEATIVKETEFRNLPNDMSSTLSSEHLSTWPTFSASFTLYSGGRRYKKQEPGLLLDTGSGFNVAGRK